MGNFSWITSDTEATILNPWVKLNTCEPFKVGILFKNGEFYSGWYDGYGRIEDDNNNEICCVFSRLYEIDNNLEKTSDKDLKEERRINGIDMRGDDELVFVEEWEEYSNMSKKEISKVWKELGYSSVSMNQGDYPDDGTKYYDDEFDSEPADDSEIGLFIHYNGDYEVAKVEEIMDKHTDEEEQLKLIKELGGRHMEAYNILKKVKNQEKQTWQDYMMELTIDGLKKLKLKPSKLAKKLTDDMDIEGSPSRDDVVQHYKQMLKNTK